MEKAATTCFFMLHTSGKINNNGPFSVEFTRPRHFFSSSKKINRVLRLSERATEMESMDQACPMESMGHIR